MSCAGCGKIQNMQFDTNNQKERNVKSSAEFSERTRQESGMKYMVNVYIPPECLEAGDCVHSRKPAKKDVNPI